MCEKIIICSECKGEGLIHRIELTDYHNRYHDEWTEKCPRCKGSGRLLETTKITKVAYKQKKVEKR